MNLKRRPQPPPPCACGCEQLAGRLAGYEATVAAMARALAALRPGLPTHTPAQALTGWGVHPADAQLIAEACARKGD